MKIGDRDTPGTRIYAEKEFREGAQVLVATEAAGEGINLQFCWLMINYDIPWNPVRLEQRMGRIHRYGQEHDCLVFNFVAQNTREGRVLEMLLTRLAEIRKDLESDKVFDVVGEVFPSNLLEKMFRDLYARKIVEGDIKDRVLSELDPQRFKQITQSTLEGLAKRDLNLSAIIGKTAEAKERRLVPEVIEDFAILAGPVVSMPIKAEKVGSHVFRAGKVPKLLARGAAQESRFGVLAKEYGRIAFDKNSCTTTRRWNGSPLGTRSSRPYAPTLSSASPTTSGAALSSTTSTLRSRTASTFSAHPSRTGARTYSTDGSSSCAFDDVGFAVRQPTIFLDLIPSKGAKAPDRSAFPIATRASASFTTRPSRSGLEATRRTASGRRRSSADTSRSR